MNQARALPPEVWAHDVVYQVGRGAFPVAGRAARPVTQWFRTMLSERVKWADAWEPLVARVRSDSSASAPIKAMKGQTDVVPVVVGDPVLHDSVHDRTTAVRGLVPLDEIVDLVQHAETWPAPPPRSLSQDPTTKWRVDLPRLHRLPIADPPQLWSQRTDRVLTTLLQVRLALLREMACTIVRDLRRLAATGHALRAAIALAWPAVWEHLGRLMLAGGTLFALQTLPPVDAAYRRIAAARDPRRARYAELAVLQVLWPDAQVLDTVLRARVVPTVDADDLRGSLARYLPSEAAPSQTNLEQLVFDLGKTYERYGAETTVAGVPPPHTATATTPLGCRWIEYTPSAPHPFTHVGTHTGGHPTRDCLLTTLLPHRPAHVSELWWRRAFQFVPVLISDKFVHAPRGTHVVVVQTLRGEVCKEVLARATPADLEDAWTTRMRLTLRARAWKRELRGLVDPAYGVTAFRAALTDCGTPEGRAAHQRVWRQLCLQAGLVGLLVPPSSHQWPTDELRKLLGDLRGEFLLH